MEEVSKEVQKELLDIDHDGKSSVHIPFAHKVIKMGYIRPYTAERITKVLLEEDGIIQDDATEEEVLKSISGKSKILAKISSIAILNGFFMINLFHWAYWRWLYYVKEYTYAQLFPIILEAKKKIPVAEYALSMGLAATMMETTKIMTRKEAKQYQQELMRAQEVLSEKNTPGQ